jgi:hypothetical protein
VRTGFQTRPAIHFQASDGSGEPSSQKVEQADKP